jgi:hypothetical protein
MKYRVEYRRSTEERVSVPIEAENRSEARSKAAAIIDNEVNLQVLMERVRVTHSVGDWCIAKIVALEPESLDELDPSV